VVAGRDPAKAAGMHGVVPMRVDLRDGTDRRRALDGADAVVMCVDESNVEVAEACLQLGVHYVDVTADDSILAGIRRLTSANAAAVLRVGLAPGITDLLVRLCGDDPLTRAGLVIGGGEHHGRAGIEWVVDALRDLGPSWHMRFPEPFGRRRVHGFPFPPIGVHGIPTGLCVDSRPLTALLTGPVARLVRNPRGRALALAALTRIHVGGDRFAAVASSGSGAAVSFGGHSQSRATGLAAALVVKRLEGMPAGVHDLDRAVDPAGFLGELASHGFAFTSGEYDAR
jgi:hypothetical protein